MTFTVSNNAKRNLYTLALANLSIWVIALMAMMLLLPQSQPIEGVAPILMGGVGVGAASIAAISEVRPPNQGSIEGSLLADSRLSMSGSSALLNDR